MSKTNVQKTAEDLYAASAGLAEKIRATRLSMVSQINSLRELENRIKNRIKEEQQRAQMAMEAETRAEAEEEALRAFETQAPETFLPITAEPVPERPAAVSVAQAPDSVPNPPESAAAGDAEPVRRPEPRKEAQAGSAGSGGAEAARRQAGETLETGRPQQVQRTRETAPQQVQRPPAGAGRQPRPADGTIRQPLQGAPGGQDQQRRSPYPSRQGQTGPDQARIRAPYPPRTAGEQSHVRPGGRPRAGAAGGRPGASPLNLKALAKELAPVQEKEKASNYNPNKKAYVREKDISMAKAKKNKKQLMREQATLMSDEEIRFRKKRKKQVVRSGIEKKVIDHAVITSEMVPIKILAERIGVPGATIVKKLMTLGVFATINQEIDFDTAALIASEFNVEIEQKLEKTFEEVMMDGYEEGEEGEKVTRPPVVTIMGHVDHGKTSLLDVIRKSHVTETEAGGITQHIGAYMIEVNGRAITFLDTPGHEAFTAMRSRGAQVTDIAVLVVAADDGVMPQTIEAINHAKAAKVPIIVAINKIDLPGANPDRVRQELMEYGLVPEEWGGENMMVEVSAHTHQGIDKLLDSILLLAEIEDLTANPNARATGTVIEAKLDRGRGPVATVLINNGTLRIGDTIVAGTTSGRIRDMFDEDGHHVEEALPSMPVEIVGFSQVPEAGDVLHSAEGDKLARRVAQERQDKIKIERMKAASKVSLDDLFSKISQGEIKNLNIIIRGDVQGSVEAVKQALLKLSTDEVKIQCIHDGVGAITENDVMLASASDAIIIGFNVRPDVNGRLAAEREKVDIRLYRIIYNAVEDMEKAIKGMLAPEYKETVLGHAQVRSVFHISGVGIVAGGYVTDGLIRRNAKVRVLRDNVVIHEGVLSSLKRFKEDAREVASGFECGIGVSGFNDVKENDVIEAYTMEEIER